MATPEGPETDQAVFTLTRRGLRRAGLIVLAVAAVLSVAGMAYWAGRSSSSGQAAHSKVAAAKKVSTSTSVLRTSTTTTAPATTTTVAPTTTTAAPTPLLAICEGPAQFEPTSLHWCSSACSSYMTDITWSSWGPTQATGYGTLATNDGIPSCGGGTWTYTPNSPVVLSNPQTTGYCSGPGMSSSVLLFTSVSIFQGDPVPYFDGSSCP